MRHGFLLHGGSYTTIDEPNAANVNGTIPLGINDRGDVVGVYFDATATTRGFLLHAGNYTTIEVPAALSTQPVGINDQGHASGIYVGTSGTHGFLMHQGSVTTIDPRKSGGESSVMRGMAGFHFRLYSLEWDELGEFETIVPNWSVGDELPTGSPSISAR